MVDIGWGAIEYLVLIHDARVHILKVFLTQAVALIQSDL